MSDVSTYSLLRQLPSALVLAVSQEFDDTTFIRRETIEGPNMISPRHAVVKPRCCSLHSENLGPFPSQDLPRNFLDDFSHKGGTFAEVAFGA